MSKYQLEAITVTLLMGFAAVVVVGINQFVGKIEGGELSPHLAHTVIRNIEQRFTTENLKQFHRMTQ